MPRRRIIASSLAGSLALGQAVASPIAGEAPGQVVPWREEAGVLPAGTPDSLDDLKSLQAALQGVLPRVLPAVVEIYAMGTHGSGVSIDTLGTIYTAAHVVHKPGTPLQITLADTSKRSGATLAGNADTDAGIVRLDTPPSPCPHVPLATEFPRVGEWVFAIGHSGGYNAARGPVVRLGRVVSLQDGLVRTDCKLIGGDSGGPLFNMRGELIGINSQIGTGLEDNIHIPTAVFAALRQPGQGPTPQSPAPSSPPP